VFVIKISKEMCALFLVLWEIFVLKDFVFLLNVVALSRIVKRVRQGYLWLARNEPERFRVVDASLDEESVAELVWQAYENKFT